MASIRSPLSVTNFPMQFTRTITLPAVPRSARLTMANSFWPFVTYDLEMTIERLTYFRDNGVYQRDESEYCLDKLRWLHAGMRPTELHMVCGLGSVAGEGTDYMEWSVWFDRYGVTDADARQIDLIADAELHAQMQEIIDLTATDDSDDDDDAEDAEVEVDVALVLHGMAQHMADDDTATTDDYMTQTDEGTIDVDPSYEEE